MVKYARLLLLVVTICTLFSFGFNAQCGSGNYEPENNISLTELMNGSEYWNNRTNTTALINKVKELASVSKQYHEYVENEYDCNDMATDIWNMLAKDEIISIIVIGDLDEEGETFADCDHAWLAILNQSSNGVVTIYALEPTNGEIYTYKAKENDPNRKYFEGFFYAKPSDMRTDLGDRW
jgi:hypothetical protein